ncbi:hypothetical protein [Nocardia sp. CY41]|uniref:hypothetical protein n=1 Tax=Nocardia sp. CY41 TaxID=2608686 RepID=UPI00135BE58F|nr:hypothetical protein [Nocardia sp. CY41]
MTGGLLERDGLMDGRVDRILHQSAMPGQPATKALLIQARSVAGLGEQVAARNRQAALIVIDDLAAAGWDDPEPVATLLVAAIADIALAELTASRPLPELRAALARLARGRRDAG